MILVLTYWQMVDGLRVLPSVLGCNARAENVSFPPAVRATIAIHGGIPGQHRADAVLCGWSKLANAYYVLVIHQHDPDCWVTHPCNATNPDCNRRHDRGLLWTATAFAMS